MSYICWSCLSPITNQDIVAVDSVFCDSIVSMFPETLPLTESQFDSFVVKHCTSLLRATKVHSVIPDTVSILTVVEPDTKSTLPL